MDAWPGRAFEGVPGDVNVFGNGPRQAADGDSVADSGGNTAHSLKIAGTGNGKPGLNDIHAEPFQLPGDLHFFVNVERRPRRLLAVAQGGVKDLDAVTAGHHRLPAPQPPIMGE